MQQPGCERLLRELLVLAFPLGDAPRGDGRSGKAVLPELLDADFGIAGGFNLGEDMDAEHERLDGFKTELHDGFKGVDEPAVQAEESGVDELQHLGGHGGIAGDGRTDFFQRGLGGLQRLEDVEINSG